MGLIGISNTVARLILGIVSQKLNRYLFILMKTANFPLQPEAYKVNEAVLHYKEVTMH